MIDVIVLAVALSMDAFAVSIGLGAKKYRDTQLIALKVALLFGFFQAFMPLVGYFAGVGLGQYIESIDHWIAFILLFLIGAKMIYESRSEDTTEDISHISNYILLTLAIATSIDAMAAGFTLSIFDAPIWLSIISIGMITFLFSYIGVFVGFKSGVWLESKAEFIGGVVLIAIGIKILWEHLFI